MTSGIIVAAGTGTRMGPNVDKLFLEVCGRPVVAHSWQRLDASAVIDELILVVRPGMESAFETLAADLQPTKPFRLVAGGAERQDSVWNGVNAVQDGAELVAIHDGARPCVDDALIAATVLAAERTGAAVAAQPVTDTMKESADGRLVTRHLDRKKLWSVQTPQCFRVNIIRKALAEVRRRGVTVTDDTAACEWIGQAVELVAGQGPNPKVTVRADLPYIELILQQKVGSSKR